MYDYLIVGAGLFGSVCAYELAEAGKKVLVIEKRDHIGGNCATEEMEGIIVHKYGPHIFHTSDLNLWTYMHRFADFNKFINSPLAFYQDKLYNLPFNMNTFYQLWGVKSPKRAQEIIDEQRHGLVSVEPKNLMEQAINLVGKDIFNKLIKGYSEKQWLDKCYNLPPDIIKRIPLRFTFDNNYFNDIYQGIPKGGYTPMFERMLEDIEVHLGIDFVAEKTYWEDKAEKVIYTGAIDRYYEYCFGELGYIGRRFDTKILNEENYQGVAVINFPDEAYRQLRMIEHKHFDPEANRKDVTAITWEYSEPTLPGEEGFYPVNSQIDKEILQMYHEMSESNHKVIFGGRMGTYQYLDMDKVVRSALDLVKNLKKL